MQVATLRRCEALANLELTTSKLRDFLQMEKKAMHAQVYSNNCPCSYKHTSLTPTR